jgi:hypothetical protein
VVVLDICSETHLDDVADVCTIKEGHATLMVEDLVTASEGRV